MFKRIIIGCDGSAEQDAALVLAQQLRDPQDGGLVLAAVVPHLRTLLAGPRATEHAKRAEERAAAALEEAAGTLDPSVPVEREVITADSAAAGLHDLAEALGADLIVLGRSDRGLVAEAAGRKTVQRLLQGAPCAIAVAGREGAARFAAEPRILVGFDASPEAAAAVEAAYAIAAATSATVVVCEVLEPVVVALAWAGYLDLGEDETVERAAGSELDRAIAQAPAGVAVEKLVRRGSPVSSELSDAAAGADLIVAGSRGFGPLHRAIAGSTSSALLNSAPTAVLVTPRAVAQPV